MGKDMPLKLNIRPRLEEEMEDLLPIAGARSKTEYINRAIEAYNREIRRSQELGALKDYFKHYGKEAHAVMGEFARLRHASRD